MSSKEIKNDKYVIKDSGERRKFDTGAQRDIQTGKGRYDLISPFAIDRLAKLLEAGAIKYNDRNWEKGIPLHSFYDSACRHLAKYMENRLLDLPQDEDHMAAAMWNLHCFLHTEMLIEKDKLPKELDDLPNAK